MKPQIPEELAKDGFRYLCKCESVNEGDYSEVVAVWEPVELGNMRIGKNADGGSFITKKTLGKHSLLCDDIDE